MTNDMTSGRIFPQLLRFSIPVVLGLLLQQFYNLVDTAIVGQALGSYALGGVGLTGSLHFLIIGFVNGLCAGMALPVATAFGAKDYGNMRRFLFNAIFIGCAMSALLLSTVLPMTGRILHYMNTPAEQFDYAYTYIFIVFCGIPATITYNLSSGILRALGDSKTPLKFLMLGSFVNIGLDLLLILVMNMGVAGAAVATVSSQLLAGVFCILFMRKNFSILSMNKSEMQLQKSKVFTLLQMGVPMGLQYSITAIGSLILQTAVNGLGPLYVSAQSAATKVNLVNVSFYDGIGVASANFTGQNLGAGEYDRIKKGTYTCYGMCLIVWITLTSAMLLFGRDIARVFVSQEECALIAAPVFMNSFCYIACGPLVAVVDVYRSAIQGLGYSGFSMFSGLMELIGRGFIGIILIPMFGYTAACFASPLAWILADIFLIPAFFYCFRKVSNS